MTQGIEQAIADLQAHLRYHERAAEKLRQALAQLRDLPREVGACAKTAAPKSARAPAAKKRSTQPKRASAKKTITRPGRTRVTLAQVVRHVLEQHRKAGTGGVKPKVLYEQVQQAGYRFGGKPDNHLRQLYKALRRHAEFKRAGDGTYALS
jgi:hypothetical protein